MSDDRVKPSVEHVEAAPASEEFGAELGRLVQRLAARLSGRVPLQDGMDLAQEGICRALERLRGCSDPDRVGAYVVAVVRRLAPDHRRRYESLPLDDEPAAVVLVACVRQPSPEEIAVKKETREALLWAVAGLPPTYRRVLGWRHWEGLTVPQCAARAGTSVEGMESLLRRAQLAAAAALRPMEPDARPAAVPRG